jgi:hypothetical protein
MWPLIDMRAVPNRDGPYVVAAMKRLFLVVLVLLPFLGSCASIRDAHFGTRDGKPSPYQPQRDPYEAPRDPTVRY